METIKLLNVKEVQRKANMAKGVAGDSFSLMFSGNGRTKLDPSSFDEPNRYEAISNHLRR